MRRLVTVLVVALVFGTAASAQAMPAEQKLVVWQHVCAASDGTTSFHDSSIVGCAHVPPAWNSGAIRKFQNVCLNALDGTFFSYNGSSFGEGAVCVLV